MKNDYLSIIGWAFLGPIGLLWEKLEEKQSPAPVEVQTNMFENGLSVAIIALTVAMVESFLNRTRHVMLGRKEYELPSKKVRDIIVFFNKKFPNSGLLESLIEIYAIRDVIMHNHVWDAVIDETGKGVIHASPPKLDDRLYGDKKFEDILVEKTLTSKKLGLNLFPTKICKEDAKKVLMAAYEILYFIESQDRSYCVISWARVNYNGKFMEMSEFIDRISGTFQDRMKLIAERVPSD